jgi:hypothetical protein
MSMAVIGNLFLTLLFSLGVMQVAQLNVLAVPVPAASSGTPTTGTQLAVKGICDITLSFFDGQSNQLKTNEVWINPGSSASLSVPPFIKHSNPGLIYGEVQLMPDSDPSCRIIPSLELLGPDGASVTPLQGGAPFAAQVPTN